MSVHHVWLENIQEQEQLLARIAQLENSTLIKVQPLSRLALHARLAKKLTLQPQQQHANRALMVIGQIRRRPAVTCVMLAIIPYTIPIMIRQLVCSAIRGFSTTIEARKRAPHVHSIGTSQI